MNRMFSFKKGDTMFAQALRDFRNTLVFSKSAINIEKIGNFLMFLGEVFRQAFRRPFRQKLIVSHIELIGNRSAGIIMLTGFSTGAVFALQMGGIFRVFGAESMIGGATGIALATELAPLITGFLLAGRSGAAMSAEIATMVVNEQVDAMEAMAVNPIHYLVVPRLLASMIIMPFLCGIFMFVGVFGAYMVGLLLFDVDEGVFVEKIIHLVHPSDLIKGLRKMFIFSFVIASVSCYYGLRASKGAKGVGMATTTAVVKTLLLLLFTDFVISYLQIKWFS